MKLTEKQILAIETEVKMMLHAHRDCLRNQSQDTTQITFDCRDGYYGEAFGIMRTLQVLGFGYFGSVNLNALEEKSSGFGRGIKVKVNDPRQNLKWWFRQLEMEVLKEEGFGENNICVYCRERYGKDAAMKKVMET